MGEAKVDNRIRFRDHAIIIPLPLGHKLRQVCDGRVVLEGKWKTSVRNTYLSKFILRTNLWNLRKENYKGNSKIINKKPLKSNRMTKEEYQKGWCS